MDSIRGSNESDRVSDTPKPESARAVAERLEAEREARKAHINMSINSRAYDKAYRLALVFFRQAFDVEQQTKERP